jgi:ribonucleotide monophosphatase NagD (HAD superfamily)
VADQYDAFLLDMWGVMHDGSRPYDGVLDAVRQLAERGKTIIILSNSSKRRDHSVKMLRRLGFDPSVFDKIITSGEVAHQMLCGRGEWLEPIRPWKPLADLLERERGGGENGAPPKRRALCLGSGDDDAGYLASCGWALASAGEADLVVARGTFTVDDGSSVVRKREDPALYESELRRALTEAAGRRLPMIVCNPDKVRPDADRPPMPGQIGDLYESMLVALWGTASLADDDGGGERQELVKRVGKPDRDVYDIALAHAAPSHRRDPLPTAAAAAAQPASISASPSAPLVLRACMVGDALETDVVGGSAAGLDTIWVLDTGIHGPDLQSRLSAPTSAPPVSAKKHAAGDILDGFNRQEGTYARGRQLDPTALIASFRW